MQRKQLEEFIKKNPNGLVDKHIRKVAWTQLLGIDMKYERPVPIYKEEYELEHQIQVDVDRGVNHMDYTKKLSSKHVEIYRNDIKDIIRALMMEDKNLQYYQGFHDIVEFTYWIGGKSWSYIFMKQFIYTYLYDILTVPVTDTLNIMIYIYDIIAIKDKQLAEFFKSQYNGPPLFAFPWFITFFTHSLDSTTYLMRLFDIFIASNPLLPLYFCAALLLHIKQDIINCDEIHIFTSIYNQNLKDKQLPIESLIRTTKFLVDRLPPDQLLQNYKYDTIHLNRLSVYKQYNPNLLDPNPFDRSSSKVSTKSNTPSSMSSLYSRLFYDKKTWIVVSAIVIGVASIADIAQDYFQNII
ncbi:hypothetical protein WA158_001494 [Blastocystis sp. Blastoise]